MNKIKPAAPGKGQTGFENNTKTKSTIKSSDCRIIPAHCPRFKKCCANICPLDPNWNLRAHLRGESICFYLLEYSKPTSRAKLGGYISKQLLDVIARVHTSIIKAHGDIRRRLKRSATTFSKLGRRPGERMDAAA